MRYETLPFETLQLVLDEENYKKVLKFCAGYAITFPKGKIIPELIMDSYKKMRKVGMSKPSTVAKLAEEFGKSKRWIYQILKENGL
ncbi:hypothetical protein [Nitratiruptor sp. SB155-2]|uniref:hypothetical protein n=1 Tax=Nitratiruptor sp. (strain SB155-2) TaxID=387092 RepID=UPI0002C38F70|nr:hypothetical protein [Nitratiruptor sp. SB155-2]BAN05341.1 hypothetical protein [Nitratiruptor phage NrS-1]